MKVRFNLGNSITSAVMLALLPNCSRRKAEHERERMHAV